MVSPLWKACSEGDLENVLEFLKSASSIDIEIKDHTGATPLIEAVKNGHTEIVRILLDRGADPSNASSHGLPEQFTTDETILELIKNAQNKLTQNAPVPPEYPQDPNAETAKQYYPPPPGPYYYPGMHPVPPLPEGALAYYPPMPPQSAPGESPTGNGNNLPPPEIARMIPCRYYPACRYGASCMFAHPQGPYYQGPPAQYPAPYDPTMHYPSNYYVVPPSFPPPNGAPMSPTSPQAGPQPNPPHPSMGHGRSSSELISPVQGHFSPPSMPPPMPYGAVSPLSPAYPHPGAVPIPVSIPPLPPLNHSVPPPHGAQSPPAMYQNAPPNGSFAVRPDAVAFPPHQIPPPHPVGEQNGGPKSPTMPPQADGYPQPPVHREGMSHHRRGSLRKPSFGGSRKPPCLFFPSGRCRNGDECRFPHVLPDSTGFQQNYPHFPGPLPRGPPRPRHLSNAANGVGSIEAKMADMTVRDDAINHHARSQSTVEPLNRGRPLNGARGGAPPGPIPRVERRVGLKQRLPSADEFPALAGATTPPKQSPGLNGHNGLNGPTAAQVLQAPPPARKDTPRESLSSNSSERGGSVKSDKDSKPAEVNGNATDVVNGIVNGISHDSPAKKLPVSFAAAATASPVSAAHDASKEVSVSA
ncbi:hypothetical protein GLOTRDRAFT_124253 [Gloeophyllum trabeum ATCC 11539]|uniref:C3H1-type domain-containing protein n=1 Tax=Gloeophyllum trabeum (strain ATCC 11539 / FP-39264 / Madison 617) TaxID=670483 RepID=S7QPU2_GLOTA|nr:uncharacterized protein GLOTRDRAFT_124253 [Gloeophyllum trabeum ATCC 11539]EPQ61417.1 hypothetical protein GLOTRDRAFT_124253 [Gloeophyllum trabeum ATCC 11539]